MDQIARSNLMAKIGSKDTIPEMIIRRELWHNGLRYRVQYGKEKIDIAFPSKKLAIFVDGCFWHSCPIHGHLPKSNTGYWKTKLISNKQRALSKDDRLEKLGWKILHLWEHEIISNSSLCVVKVQSIINMKRNDLF